MIPAFMVLDLHWLVIGSWNGGPWGLKLVYSGHRAQLPLRQGPRRAWVIPSHFCLRQLTKPKVWLAAVQLHYKSLPCLRRQREDNNELFLSSPITRAKKA